MTVQDGTARPETPAQLLCDKALARQFKAQAALEGLSIRECLNGLIRSYLAVKKDNAAWAQKTAKGSK